MKTLITALAFAGAMASSAHAVTIDGARDGSYVKYATVAYDPAAPSSNFGAPVAGTNGLGYDLYFTTDQNFLYGFLETSGPGASAGTFSNLYFDVDATNGASVDVVYEITNQRGSVDGGSSYFAAPITFSTTAGAYPTIEFAISWAAFVAPNPNPGDRVTVRGSQSFGYTYSGAPASRAGLASFNIPAAVPEPATWAMMLVGFFGLGSAVRANRRATAFA